MITKSRCSDVEIPELSLPAFVLDRAAELGDKPALVDGPTGRTTSYADLADAVGRAAAGFAAREIGHGDVVALMAPNSPDWVVAFLGAQAAGAAVTTINSLYTAEEILTQLLDAGARCLVTAPAFLDRAGVAAEKAGIIDVIVFGSAPGTTPFAELLGHGDAPPDVTIDPASDPAMVPYSSGTTGLPKGVLLSHRSMVASSVQTQPLFAYTPDGVTIAVLPYFHLAGNFTELVHPLRGGATVVTMPRFDLEQFLGLIQTHEATKVVVVPPIVLALARHPVVDRCDLSSLQVLASGAAPLGADLEQECSKRLGCPVGQGYGMSETSPMITVVDVTRIAEHPPGTAGLLVASTEARLVDPATGTDAPTGELWIRGPQVMLGYLNNPEATAATIDADGWLHTGDLGTVDANGYVFLLDRVKELIKYKAYQVAPAELEALLVGHPAVADAGVVGRPDPEVGERPVAFVVRRGEVSADQLIAYVAERVAPYKKVREVVFVDEIPRSATGKILRRVLAGL
jgi:acyl-CoA synthetase (AMP-forming)/AMP-acid ligase II